MNKTLVLFIFMFAILMVSGCETWQGVKKDTNKGAQWSKDKVNDGAKYIEKKTD